VQIRPAGESLAQSFDTGLFAVDRDYQLAIEQQTGEIPDAAPHFHDPLAQFPHYQAALPGKIILRPRHLPLVFKREFGGRLRHYDYDDKDASPKNPSIVCRR
jgi:hypothetical protein